MAVNGEVVADPELIASETVEEAVGAETTPEVTATEAEPVAEEGSEPIAEVEETAAVAGE